MDGTDTKGNDAVSGANAAPLAGVRVLDLSNVIAGPMCTYAFSLLGAEVIKIERPGTGDLARKMGADPDRGRKLMGTSFLANNSGKRSVTLNLKSEKGREIFERMLVDADVVFENFRPGTMDKLGLPYGRLKEINPRVVYCAISGFGADGPLAQRAAYDQIIQSMSGLMSLTGTRESGPTRAGFVVCDGFAAITAAFATLAGLLRARATGQGANIDVSMLDSSLMMAGWIISNLLNAGREPEPMGNENHSAAPSGTYQAKDGPITIVCNEDSQFLALCDALGRPDLKESPVWSDRYERIRRRSELIAMLEPMLQERTAKEWEEHLTRFNVPSARVYTVPEILEHPQLRHRGFVARVPDVPGSKDGARVPTLGFRMLGEDVKVPSAPPTLGQDNADVYGRLGFDAADLQRLRQEKVI